MPRAGHRLSRMRFRYFHHHSRDRNRNDFPRTCGVVRSAKSRYRINFTRTARSRHSIKDRYRRQCPDRHDLAQQVGLNTEQVLTGRDIQMMSDAALMRQASDVDVFAEIEPGQKERLILALKKAGHVLVSRTVVALDRRADFENLPQRAFRNQYAPPFFFEKNAQPFSSEVVGKLVELVPASAVPRRMRPNCFVNWINESGLV